MMSIENVKNEKRFKQRFVKSLTLRGEREREGRISGAGCSLKKTVRDEEEAETDLVRESHFLYVHFWKENRPQRYTE